mmetsp:Transcript_916/g.1257  ORF Transcript_916/g.1257 Transcript_916/m.1257 type:complete len:176 (+) Transcript_916:396-923(+)|eukprot:CAMPEP_0185573198 /NCGR_PEP_ID=MMETSP0434-20130131/4970_1 /TAXON_ID=626734 ORGANISM="Favella taraikaensis, Strain Fe Narragansett Bay" /NCGR_SAMPLE_ID=MMETSP0434 /ASSEMBLY_ACC=CAM_ASM_000379 /LENGTH=175 /DNA_ID=CAMNT_0028189351 /DNA_START=331 /DNA_END=858 /DNA_ORIENTATION=+
MDTPLGELEVDQEVVDELRRTKRFSQMSRRNDEVEHSLEMHLPMLQHVFKSVEIKPKVIPIVVGGLTRETEREYAAILAPYFAQADTLFIVSSDFCHWGDDFDFTPYENLRGGDGGSVDEESAEWTPVWEFIQALDMAGLELVEKQDAEAFHRYCEETDNTICGRHPISILLAML